MFKRHTTSLSLIALAAAAALLAGCDRKNDGQTATGQKIDSAVSTVKEKTENAAKSIENKIDDATITASVNAELAKDPKLSALKINVDTANGRVSLRGTAPDKDSRERATVLAASVKGVSGVDNQLQVQG